MWKGWGVQTVFREIFKNILAVPECDTLSLLWSLLCN